MKRRSLFLLLSFLLIGFAVKAQQTVQSADSSAPVIIDTLPPDFFYIQFPSILQEHSDESIQDIINFAHKKRDYVIRTYSRDQRFGKTIIPILKKYNVPAELRVLVALESAYNPNAISGAGAVGYWQFMDESAREYGLTIVSKEERKESTKSKKGKATAKVKTAKKKTPARDDRKHLIRSMYAAAKYLRDRCRNFNNDWLLIVASYNYGVGNVWEAMRKSGKENPTFWDIKHLLPAETRNYVTNFINLSVLLHNYKAFVNGDLVFELAPQNNEETVSAATGIATADKDQ